MPITRHGYKPRTRNGSTRAYRKARAHALNYATHCGICGQPFQPDDRIEADHITPHKHGGTDHATNLRPAHRACNLARGAGV